MQSYSSQLYRRQCKKEQVQIKNAFQPIFNVTMALQKEMKFVFLESKHYSQEIRIQEIIHASNLYPNL